MEMTGAQALVESLKLANVEHMFGYAGATICPAVDALANAPEIGYTLVRTEQNAGHMASGYYRVTGKVGVCMVTSGPGATNLITGIATAYMDSIPMVAITGQVPSHLLGRDIFQEVDITGAVAPFSKHSYLVKDANDIPRVVAEAFHIASTGRPGPVLIDLPIDIQEQELKEFHYPEQVNLRSYKPSVRGNDLQIKRVVAAIEAAQRPVICAGGGVFLSHAEQELLELAERTHIPVVTTMMGLSLLPTEHPLNMGMLGAHGNVYANKAVAKSDLLIMIGCRVADRAILSPAELAKRTAIVHIDVDPAEIGKNMKAAIPVVGEVKAVISQLLKRLEKRSGGEWLEKLQHFRRQELTRPLPSREGYIFPGTLLRALGDKLRYNAAVCVDVGQNQIWACKHLKLGGGRFLTSGGLGTMGYSLPAAVGVKVAQPERQTVVICGDGSFQMSMNELAAVSAAGMDIKIVLFQNNILGLVHQIQSTPAYPAGPFGVSLDGSPDFSVIADAYGIQNRTLSDEAELDEALDEMLSSEGSYLLICRVHPDATTND
ncbi:MAG: biosynthetic-type acetolactate synthase large subunit [Oscillospiraceae bacterium]|nr:biosynthetic-type acetolactate synthase large subunit [Oscillospiraceae bacterium]